MNVTLWVLAGLLAAVFLLSGVMKVARSKAQLADSGQGWTEDFSAPMIKFIGLAEVAAAIGLILPPALDIAPVLAPIAALGAAVVMVGAAITHGRRKEYPNVLTNLVLLAIAVVVAWGRFGPYSL